MCYTHTHSMHIVAKKSEFGPIDLKSPTHKLLAFNHCISVCGTTQTNACISGLLKTH